MSRTVYCAGPKTLDEVHKEAQQEQATINQAKHDQKRGKGGRGGRNSQGGNQQFKAIARRPEKVDANRFAGGSNLLGKDMLGGGESLPSAEHWLYCYRLLLPHCSALVVLLPTAT